MCLKRIGRDARSSRHIQARLLGHNLRRHDHGRPNFPKLHPDQTKHADVCAGHERLHPQLAVLDEGQHHRGRDHEGNTQGNRKTIAPQFAQLELLTAALCHLRKHQLRRSNKVRHSNLNDTHRVSPNLDRARFSVAF